MVDSTRWRVPRDPDRASARSPPRVRLEHRLQDHGVVRELPCGRERRNKGLLASQLLLRRVFRVTSDYRGTERDCDERPQGGGKPSLLINKDLCIRREVMFRPKCRKELVDSENRIQRIPFSRIRKTKGEGGLAARRC